MITPHKIIVKHIAKEKGWDNIVTQNPTTLIIGSFNPFIPNKILLPDYYYGRNPTRGAGNKLWNTIGKVKYNNKTYFRNDFSRKIIEVSKLKIYFYDLISELEFMCENKILLEKFINEKVYKNFADNIIWQSTTKYCGELITIKRIYNYNILKFLTEYHSVKRVVNTLGKKRGNYCFNPNEEQWIQYKNDIFNTCTERGIDLVLESVSPSARGGSELEFENWLKKYIKI